MTALCKVDAEVDHPKDKDINHNFELGTGTSAEGRIVDAIRFRKTTRNRRLTNVYRVVDDIQRQLWVRK